MDKKVVPGVHYDMDGDAPILDAIIIGSGLGGVCQAVKFKEHNIHSFIIFEKESGLGGT